MPGAEAGGVTGGPDDACGGVVADGSEGGELVPWGVVLGLNRFWVCWCCRVKERKHSWRFDSCVLMKEISCRKAGDWVGGEGVLVGGSG